jgi:hypothetical protein
MTVPKGTPVGRLWDIFGPTLGGVERKLGRRLVRFVQCHESMDVASVWLSKVRRASLSSSSVPCR